MESKNISEKLKKSIDIVSAAWKDSPYYENAEKWLNLFWSEGTIFKQLFSKLDLTHVVELAVGHGRHAEIVAKMADELVVMDVHEENLIVCRKRLNDYSNIRFRKCEGAAFDAIEDNWASSIYCYDAMVHFSPDIVESYLKDSYRILRKGGKALYHHSNYPSPIDQPYGKNPHARNHMTKQLFSDLCNKTNLKIIDSIVIPWGSVEDLDCVTLLEKV